MRTFLEISGVDKSCLLAIVLLSLLGSVSCALPTPMPPTSTIQIDWVNYIRFGGITYLASTLHAGHPLQVSDLGPQFAIVKFKLEGHVQDPHYQARDGDAAFLDVGTRIYTVKGYKPTFWLTANVNHNVLLFEADTNPKAKIGADLLDIGGKVNHIGVNSNQDGTTELAAIKNPKQVAQLVAMVLSAPVDQTRVGQGGPQYFLAFHLKDGTVVIRAYWLNSGELTRGILLPKAFGSVVAHALSRNHTDFPLQAPFNQG
jgi:hypothetical protein